MKKIFIVFGILILTHNIFAQATTFSDRSMKSQTVVAMQTPYTFIQPVSVASVNWTVPDSVVICELRCKTRGDICVSVPYKDSVIIAADNYDIFRAQITKIYKTGTTAALRDTALVLFGIRK